MISPTVSLISAARTMWDVVVVGAGPAGALSAYQLARNDHNVLLVDKKSFPRSKVCGGCANPRALSILQSVGLRERVSGLGAIDTQEFSLWQRNQNVTLPVTGGMAVSRAAFDEMLVDAAIEAGAAFLDNATALLEDQREDCVSVRLTQSSQNETIQAQVAIAAGGLGSQFLKQFALFETEMSTTTRVGIGCVVSKVDDLYQPGTIYMAVSQHGYAGIVQVEDNRLCAAAAVDRSVLKSSGQTHDRVASILKEAGLPTNTFDGTIGQSVEWKGTTGLTCRTNPVAANRVFLIGDATGYVEPFTGEGIAWALSAACSVAPLISRGLNQWESKLAHEWIGLHQRAIRRRQRLCRTISQTLRRPMLVGVLMRLLKWQPALANPIVRRLNTEVSVP